MAHEAKESGKGYWERWFLPATNKPRIGDFSSGHAMLFLSFCLLSLNIGERIGRGNSVRPSSLNLLIVVLLVFNSLASGFRWSQVTTVVLRLITVALSIGVVVGLFR